MLCILKGLVLSNKVDGCINLPLQTILSNEFLDGLSSWNHVCFRDANSNRLIQALLPDIRNYDSRSNVANDLQAIEAQASEPEKKNCVG
jgi:hypothetical protein